MIIARFGATYETAYVLPRSAEIDTWSVERPAIYARVSGLPGVFDFYGDTNFPWLPVTLRKSMLISGATYTAVQTAVDALQAATIAINESTLWMLRRDGATRSCPAKCISLKISDQAGQLYFIRAEIEFYCREGISNLYIGA